MSTGILCVCGLRVRSHPCSVVRHFITQSEPANVSLSTSILIIVLHLGLVLLLHVRPSVPYACRSVSRSLSVRGFVSVPRPNLPISIVHAIQWYLRCYIFQLIPAYCLYVSCVNEIVAHTFSISNASFNAVHLLRKIDWRPKFKDLFQ